MRGQKRERERGWRGRDNQMKKRRVDFGEREREGGRKRADVE